MKEITLSFVVPDDYDTDNVIDKAMETLGVSGMGMSYKPHEPLIEFEVFLGVELSVLAYSKDEAMQRVGYMMDDAPGMWVLRSITEKEAK